MIFNPNENYYTFQVAYDVFNMTRPFCLTLKLIDIHCKCQITITAYFNLWTWGFHLCARHKNQFHLNSTFVALFCKFFKQLRLLFCLLTRQFSGQLNLMTPEPSKVNSDFRPFWILQISKLLKKDKDQSFLVYKLVFLHNATKTQQQFHNDIGFPD